MVMHDDTVTTSWRRLTDKVKGLWSDGVGDAFAGTSRPLPQTTCAASHLNRPAAPAAMPHAGLVILRGGAAPAHAATATAPCRTDRDREANQAGAPPESGGDEGGRRVR